MVLIFSDRLELKNFTVLDRDELFDILSSKIIFTYEQFECVTKSSVKELIERIKDSDNYLAVYNSKAERIIGLIKLEELNNNTIKLWIAIKKRFQGKGFASEALKSIIKYLFVNTSTRRIVCFTDSKNYPCIKLIENLNFRKESILIEERYISLDENNSPIWCDVFGYAMLRSEWQERESQQNPPPKIMPCFSEFECERLTTLFNVVHNSFSMIYKDFLKLNIFRRQNLQTDMMKYGNTTFEAATTQFNNLKENFDELLKDNKSDDFQKMLEKLSDMKKYYKMNYDNAQQTVDPYERNILMNFYSTKIREINDFISLADKDYLAKSLLKSTAI